MISERTDLFMRQLAAMTGQTVKLAILISLLAQGCGRKQITGTFPEELVFATAKDDIVNGGALFAPPKDRTRAVAIIWIHGWGVNFYQPSYVKIGRALAERGYTCITANTRMHDLGNVA